MVFLHRSTEKSPKLSKRQSSDGSVTILTKCASHKVTVVYRLSKLIVM